LYRLFTAGVAERKSMVRAGDVPATAQRTFMSERHDVVRCIFNPTRAAIAVRIIARSCIVGEDGTR